MILVIVLAVLLVVSLGANAVLADLFRDARQRAHDAATHASDLAALYRKDRP